MTKEQLQTVVGLITGCQTAMITMADFLSKTGAIDRDALADHFENSALTVPAHRQNREMIVKMLEQMARGLRAVGPQDPDAIQKLFH